MLKFTYFYRAGTTLKSTEILKKYWGFDSFRGIQEDIVNASIYGKDVLALLPTGGGKSICFQVPGLAREGICIVISPLIALMQDQVANLQKQGIRAKAIVSGMSKREIDIILDNAKFGGLDFLYVSPERLKTKIFLARFRQMNVSLIAIDEAHCISEWGHDFRPSYAEIVKIREIHPHVPFMAVTATATEKVRKNIIEKLELKDVQYFESNFNRPNLSYEVYKVEDKLSRLNDIAQKFKQCSGIIYCQTRRDTKTVAKLLLSYKHKVAVYHGGMKNDERKQVLDLWLKNSINIVVATNAFGMGIDKPDVRFVAHYQVPNSLEAYFQEAGRAGRDGKNARTFALFESNDIAKFKNQLEKQFPPIAFIKNVYRALCNFLTVAIGSGLNETYPFDMKEFIKRFGFHPAEAYNALKILELNGDIILNEAVHHPTRLKFSVSNNAVYSFQIKYDKYSDIITWLSRGYAGIFSEYATIDEKAIAKRLKTNVSHIQEQLKYIETHGVIDIQWASDLPQVTFTHERLPDDYLSIKPVAYKERKETATEKLNAMLSFLHKPQCRAVQILKYFSQETKACGKCDVCLIEGKNNYTSVELIRIIKEQIKTHTSINIKALADELNLKDPKHYYYLIDYMLDEEHLVLDGNNNITSK